METPNPKKDWHKLWFEEWIKKEIPFDHIVDKEQLYKAWRAGYELGYEHGY